MRYLVAKSMILASVLTCLVGTSAPVPCEVQAQDPVSTKAAKAQSGNTTAPVVNEAVVTVKVNDDYLLNLPYNRDKQLLVIPGCGPTDCIVFRGFEPAPGMASILIRPKREGSFVISFLHVGETQWSTLTVRTGEGPDVTPPGPGPVTPPVTPPTAGKFYFVVIRPDGPAAPDFAAYMGNQGWKDLVQKGHTVKDKTISEAAALGIRLPDGTSLPCIVTLVVAADGGSSRIARGAIPLPAPADIIKLAEGVK